MTVAKKLPTVNKEALVNAAATSAGKTKAETEVMIDALLGAIRDGLASGADVRVHGIGILRTRVCGAHVSRNPRTGEPVDVPARRAVRFSAARELCAAVQCLGTDA
jgi:DNA-binding protein HU-beta